MELLIAIAIILIILAFAVPNLRRANSAANEVAAVRAIQTINQGQTLYLSTYKRYAQTLVELGPPPGGGPATPDSADLIPEDLAEGLKSGYVFTMLGTPDGYSVNAEPITFGTTGNKTFYTDHTLVVRENFTEAPASPSDSPI